MTHKAILAVVFAAATLSPSHDLSAQAEKPAGKWLSWRGPNQNGSSLEVGLPRELKLGWTYELASRGTPVIGNGRIYAMGYEGEKAELQEILVCLDEKTGRPLWEHRFSDFLSDIIYYRFAIGSPTIDPDTGNVLCMSTSGLLTCLAPDGKVIWQRSMMAEYGRLTFPNGRTGAPLVYGDQCIVHIISSSWGPHGPARDRFHSFDKLTGEPRWSCTPGGPPKDSSFSFPVVGTENGTRVLYAGLGGGYVVCINAHTGQPIWRFKLAIGGLSSSVVRYKDTIIAMNGKENVDDSKIGRMVAIRCGAKATPKGPAELGKDAEVWRNDLIAFTSSPVVAGNRVFETIQTGELYCVNADTGKPIWHLKLAPDQIHASPAWGDGKLYVPMNNGMFFIVEDGERGKVLAETQLEGACLGAPAIAGGNIYVHSTKKLYCFVGGSGKVVGEPAPLGALAPKGKAVALQVTPGDLLAKIGETVPYKVQPIDATGQPVGAPVTDATWKGLPKSKVTMTDGKLKIAADASASANLLRVEADGLAGTARLRIVPGGDFTDDFNDAKLVPHPADGHPFSFPRPWWPGARPKWEILELDGEKVLAKTLSNPLFQRTITTIGHPDASNYTMQMDVATDGNRRVMSSVGMVNQRYLIVLKGNYKELEVSSNMELLKVGVKYRWKRNTWYTMKSRVDVNPDGSGVVRAKVWVRGTDEPKDWTIEVPHSHAHKQGTPGIYGFVPQSRFRVYIDNISVKSNS